MKQMKYAAFAFAMVLTLTGCGSRQEYTDSMEETDGNSEIILDEDGLVAEDILANSYRTTELDDIRLGGWRVGALGNYLLYMSFDDLKKITTLCWYNSETGESGEVIPKCVEGKNANDTVDLGYLTMPDGRLGLLCTVTNNLEKETKIISRCIELYDENLNYAETIEIPEEVGANQYLSASNFAVDGNGDYYVNFWDPAAQNNITMCYNQDFQCYGEIPRPGFAEMLHFYQGSKGDIFAVAPQYDKNGSSSYYKLYRADAQTRTYTEIGNPICPRGWNPCVFKSGTGEYDLYYNDGYGIYGIKDGEVTYVMSLINSDLPINSVNDFAPFANGTFFLDTLDYNTYQEKRYLASHCTPEDVKDTQLITLSTVGMYDTLENIVISYNRQDTGVRIILQDYANYNTVDDQSLGYAKLREDLLDGIVADIVCTDGLNFESLAGKGIFADWYELMDADPEFNRSDYMENYFESMEYGGKLQRLGVSYCLQTALAKTEHVGEEQGRTLAEFMELPIPDEMERFHFYNLDYALDFWFTCAQNSFVDRSNARCDFDTPAFAALLESLKSYSTDEYTGIWMQSVPGEQPPMEDSKAFLEDRKLVHLATFAQPIDYYALSRTAFRDAPITLIGYPTAEEDAIGGVFRSDFTLSVNAQSEEKDAVWNFMKYLLSEKYQKKLTESMPVHKATLEYQLELATNLVGTNVYYDGNNVNIGAATQESMDTLAAYLNSVKTAFYYDATVEQVLREETEMFLAGDQTAEQAAKMIQSRVSLYLSEQS